MLPYFFIIYILKLSKRTVSESVFRCICSAYWITSRTLIELGSLNTKKGCNRQKHTINRCMQIWHITLQTNHNLKKKWNGLYYSKMNKKKGLFKYSKVLTLINYIFVTSTKKDPITYNTSYNTVSLRSYSCVS